MAQWRRALFGVDPDAAADAVRAAEAAGQARLAARQQEARELKGRLTALEAEQQELRTQAAQLEEATETLAADVTRAEGHAIDVLGSAMAVHRGNMERLQNDLRLVVEQQSGLREAEAHFARELLELVERYLTGLPAAQTAARSLAGEGRAAGDSA